MEIETGDLEKLPFKIYDPMASSTLCLMLTDGCNIACSYCFNYVSDNNSQMPSALAVSIIDFYFSYHTRTNGKNKCPQIIFFGGEPTLNHKTIFEVMAYINQNKIDCVPRLVPEFCTKNK